MGTNSKTVGSRIRDRLAGHHMLITGSTGFLAKAFVEKLLRSVDTLAGIHLLVRSRPGGPTARQRVTRDVLGSPAFDRLRAVLGQRFDELCETKIEVVSGDLTKTKLGLDDGAYQRLTEKISLIVNSAATVTFDERLDWAIELNTLGPQKLLALARDCGNIPFQHVSTCYVCGTRTGTIIEDFSAPEKAREKLPRVDSSGAYDLDRIIHEIQTEATDLRDSLGADTEDCRLALIDAGMRKARSYGWNDTYTFTKWLGEQLLLRNRGQVPLSIFRPAIIESSYEEPTPGWIDGLRMADPLIVAYGRGKLNEFPASLDITLDFIPVDFVANAMIATLPVEQDDVSEASIYQCASSDTHPLALRRIPQLVRRAFIKRPMNGDNGNPVYPKPLRLVNVDTFLAKWKRRQRWVARARDLLKPFQSARRRVRKLTSNYRQIDQLIYFAKIYSPYTHLDCRFATDNLQSTAESMHPDDRCEFTFDVKQIDWEDYLINRHVPGLRAFVLGGKSEPATRILAAQQGEESDPSAARNALAQENLFEVFRCTAARFPDTIAFQIRRENRRTTYTYDQALRATGTIVRRFRECGLAPRDRVVIWAANGPEWALTYLAVMRAGLTAVPLDPQLPVNDVLAAARFTNAKLICTSPPSLDGLSEARQAEDAAVVTLSEPFVPPPAASRDPAPDEVQVDASSIASILFTSGTTVSPKAVPLTHRNLLANAQALIDVHPAFHGDQFLSVLPAYHAFEFMGGMLVPIAAGSSITYVEQLGGAAVRAAMQETGTTVMLVVPRLLRVFHDAISSQLASAGLIKRMAFRVLGGLSAMTGRRYARRLFAPVHNGFGGRLRMLVSGGSRLDPDLHDSFSRLGFNVCEGYGLTETAPVLTVNPAGASRAGSVGRPLSNVELDIRNRNLEDVGEVWVKGPNVMAGYLDNEAATREVLREGWFRTGDLGRLDEDGFLHITGRSSDLIITDAGKNVYPDEVEARYHDLPYVSECCVLGMPASDGFGDVVHAVLVLDLDANPDVDRSSMEREIRFAAEAVAEGLPPYQRIAVLHFWERELPKTSTLKAKRNVVRRMIEAMDSGLRVEEHDSSPGTASVDSKSIEHLPDNPKAREAIYDLVAMQCRSQPDSVRPESHLLLDLGIDSIGKIDLLSSVEAMFSLRLDDDRATSISRVSDILHLAGDREPKAGNVRDAAVWKRRLTADDTAGNGNGSLPAPLVPIRWLVRGGVRAFMSSYVRVHAECLENLPATGAFILAPNHSSHLDTPSVISAIGSRRRVWVAGAEDYFFDSAMKKFLFGKLLDTIPFDRRTDGFHGLKRCGEALARGDGLLIYPEGTRSITGEMQPFRIGVAVLAVERGIPIVPVHIHRTFDLLRKGQRFIRPGRVTVRFDKPIQPPILDDSADHYEAFQTLTRQVEEAVARRVHEAIA